MKNPAPSICVLLAAAAATAGPPPASAGPDLLGTFEKKVTRHTLANGWRFLIVEERDAPVVSFFTHVDVGAAQEHYGITGLAHMFEHMAFKGTDRIGTTDARAEAEAIARIEAAMLELKAERQKVGGPGPEKLKALEAAFKQAEEAAEKFVKANEFGEIIDKNGGVGLNAFTNSDETGYFFSLPANKVELWAYLESERFLRPVFRQFYKERDVVKEERRMRTDSRSQGRLNEEFNGAAFRAHPYGHPVVGHMSDLDSFTLTDAMEFHRKYYVPANMVTAVVGDVKAPAVIPVLEAYFGRIPGAPASEPLRTVEPPQKAERRVSLFDPGQPLYFEGYHVPDITHPDTPALDALTEVLGRGRTSRLYREMVRDQKIAASVFAFTPGGKYPGLVNFRVVPTPGHKAGEMAEPIHRHIKKLQAELLTPEELQQVKSRALADLVRGLGDNQGLAINLVNYEAYFGDWRALFRNVEKIEKVTAEDVQRVAREYLKPENRTVGLIVKDESEL